MGRDGKIKPFDPDLKILNQGETPAVRRRSRVDRSKTARFCASQTAFRPICRSAITRFAAFARKAAARLIVAPPKCFFRENFRAWGWALQLYSLRSAKSWGMGDFADLRAFCHWTANEHGAGIIMTNPLNAAGSRYSPTDQPLLAYQPHLPQSAVSANR